jgi:transcriptional regulator
MYSPELFREHDPRRLGDLVDAHPFGTLIAQDDDGAVQIAHVPFVLDRGVGPHGWLRFHVAKANPIWRAALESRSVVAVFRGPDAYVSASWYEKPLEQVPTWNYAVVHAHGVLDPPMTKDDLHRLLVDLAAIHEAGSASPWRVNDLDPVFRDELLDQIVGLSMPVARLEGKFKLSQNRSDADRVRVVEALAARGGADDLEMVELMR